jgi:predicted esterase
MRNTVHALSGIAILSMVQLGCGAGAPSNGDTETSPEATEPSQDLTSGTGTAGGDNADAPPVTTTDGGNGADAESSEDAGANGEDAGAPIDPDDGAGPKPTATCTVSKNADGFFTLSSPKSSFVTYVPASYDGSKPVRLIVGLHGCGDNAMNFATWGVNPYDTRKTQEHIGISIGGKDGACWSMGEDDDKVLAAVDAVSQCFWIHQKKVTIAGFSSGGQLAYRVGLMQAARFAGILIEDSGLYAAGANEDTLLGSAAWKLNIAHLTHTSDPTFPLSQVQADWTKTLAAGFPLLTTTTPGLHDGTSADWATWLIPQSVNWRAP